MPPTNNGAPQIVPGNAQMGELQLHPIIYVVPDQYPHGLNLVVLRPGSLQPLGEVNIPKGSLVAVIPPGPLVKAMLETMQRAAASQGAPRPTGPGL